MFSCFEDIKLVKEKHALILLGEVPSLSTELKTECVLELDEFLDAALLSEICALSELLETAHVLLVLKRTLYFQDNLDSYKQVILEPLIGNHALLPSAYF